MSNTLKLQSNLDAIRKKAENDLIYFAKLMNPMRLYGDCHLELFEWWTKESRKYNQLALLPRGHQKSHCAAVKALWDIVRDPCTTILYISATATLAEAQLFAIKQMIESETFKLLWPEYVNKEEAKRERWTSSNIIIDHPKRKLEGVRDHTIAARGVTANITGLHCDAIYLDDVVVPNNAYTNDGREKVAALYSQLASIKNTGAEITVVGTRYHPKDLYDTLLGIKYHLYDEETGDYFGEDYVYEVMERKVEEQGVFLWPRSMRNDGKFYGFDIRELSRIKAEYVDSTQFFAQYYNNPNDPENARIAREKFQYYDAKHLKHDGLHWYFRDNRLNVFAAIDFAFSMSNKADSTAIVVVGLDSDNNVYVLDIDRFKTDRIALYFKHILSMYDKWQFKKIRAETTVAQAAVVRELKEGYIKPNGLALSIDEFRPNRHEGNKEERISSILEPRYDNMNIWHYKGGMCTLLEEELLLVKPPHDDIKDALAAAVDVAIAPKKYNKLKKKNNVLQFNSRFGGFGTTHGR